MKEAYSLELWLEGQALGLAHTEVHVEMLSGNTGQEMPSIHSPSASLQLISISQEGAYTFVWSPDF